MSAPKASAIDRAILALSPGWAERRMRARLNVQAYSHAFDAIGPNRLHKRGRDYGDGNAVTAMGHRELRDKARQLERNHDLSRGILNTMVQCIVGPNGIGVEPQPRDKDGNVLNDLAQQLTDLWNAWSRSPEVTGEYNRGRYEQLKCRTWLRDGEVLWQYVEGTKAKLTHGTAVPLSIEMLECDLLPIDFNDPTNNISQGIEIDAWGRPQAYWLYKQHPGEPFVAMPDIKRVPTANIGHLKLTDRIGQRRGYSIFASILNRLDDLKDYEESERIAARIAASMGAVIKKGDAQNYPDSPPTAQRNLHFQPGMIFDGLQPGEDISMINSNRPNPNATAWRNGQMGPIAAGVGANKSTITRNYDGNYSAQRQELVEGWQGYALLSQAYIDQDTSETYSRFVAACLLGGLLKNVPRGISFANLAHAQFIPPTMPWIDPVKEAQGLQMMEDRCYMSGSEIVRRSGRQPADVIRAQAKWQTDLKDASVVTQDAPTAQPTYKRQPPVADAAPIADASGATAPAPTAQAA